MYINGEYRGDDALGKLMHDFTTPNADEMIYDRLAEKVRFYKQNETGVQMASKIVEEYGDERAAEALKQGIQQGEQQKAIEGAILLIKEYKETPEVAAQKMNAPLEKVLERVKSNNENSQLNKKSDFQLKAAFLFWFDILKLLGGSGADYTEAVAKIPMVVSTTYPLITF